MATGPLTAFYIDAYVGGTTQTPPGVYVAQSTDPVRGFTINNYWGQNSVIQAAYGTLSFSRHAPNNMTANTTDGMLVIISPDHLTAMDGEGWNNYAQLPATGSLGTLVAGLMINEDLKGPGWNGTAVTSSSPAPWPSIAINSGDEATPYPLLNPTSGSGFYSAGATCNAAGYGLLGGMIRSGELRAGIPHALQLITSGLSKNQYAPGGHSWVWPATTSDGGGNPGSGYGTTGNTYMGSLFAIPRSVNLASYTWNHPEALNIAKALQNYGGYVSDSGGNGSFIEVRTELAVVLNNQIPSDAGWNSDMTQIQNLIQVVTNSFNPTTGGQPRTGYKIDGGDGTVNAALIAPPFGSQWGGGNGRNSYYIPRIPASLWAWIIPSTLDQWFRAEVQSSRALAHAGR